LYKWILGVGLLVLTENYRFAIIGFVIGSIIDFINRSNARSEQSSGYSNSGFDYYRQHSTRYDFPTMLMALSAVVMKADGTVKRVELDYVKGFFNAQFGNQFTTQHLQVLKRFLDSGNIPVNDICSDIRTRLPIELRVQLVHYLFSIAKSDGHVEDSEVRSIQELANKLGVPALEFESLKNMFYRSADSDYKILGIEASASDDEVKKAYRKMAVAFHPDKVAQLGPEYEKGAKEKFQQIQDAYENIKRKRGMK
jgi:DnaJ like chaperone protein